MLFDLHTIGIHAGPSSGLDATVHHHNHDAFHAVTVSKTAFAGNGGDGCSGDDCSFVDRGELPPGGHVVGKIGQRTAFCGDGESSSNNNGTSGSYVGISETHHAKGTAFCNQSSQKNDGGSSYYGVSEIHRHTHGNTNFAASLPGENPTDPAYQGQVRSDQAKMSPSETFQSEEYKQQPATLGDEEARDSNTTVSTLPDDSDTSGAGERAKIVSPGPDFGYQDLHPSLPPRDPPKIDPEVPPTYWQPDDGYEQPIEGMEPTADNPDIHTTDSLTKADQQQADLAEQVDSSGFSGAPNSGQPIGAATDTSGGNQSTPGNTTGPAAPGASFVTVPRSFHGHLQHPHSHSHWHNTAFNPMNAPEINGRNADGTPALTGQESAAKNSESYDPFHRDGDNPKYWKVMPETEMPSKPFILPQADVTDDAVPRFVIKLGDGNDTCLQRAFDPQADGAGETKLGDCNQAASGHGLFTWGPSHRITDATTGRCLAWIQGDGDPGGLYLVSGNGKHGVHESISDEYGAKSCFAPSARWVIEPHQGTDNVAIRMEGQDSMLGVPKVRNYLRPTYIERNGQGDPGTAIGRLAQNTMHNLFDNDTSKYFEEMGKGGFMLGTKHMVYTSSIKVTFAKDPPKGLG